ncbi:MAG: peptidase M23b [Parcubacteria group bacterium]|nr:peptidase M23b [Parcubacteria group bacterium]
MKRIFLCLAKLISILFLVGVPAFFNGLLILNASSIEELKSIIDLKNRQKLEIEREIAEYEQKAIEAGKSAKTLQGTINTLNLTKKKIESDIKSTENRIGITSLSIEKLEIETKNTEKKINIDIDAISSAFRKINVAESSSLVETMLTYDNVSTLWDEVETLLRFQIGLKKNIDELKVLKNELRATKTEKERNKKELLIIQSELKDQKELIEYNKNEKDQLLAATKNNESNYKKILTQKKALSEAFEKELLQFESELKIAIDPKSIPRAGSGILSWPLDKILVTQYFGNTDFAIRRNAYNGKGHNGVDFQAAPGTRVKAALDGVVMGTGDTDKVCKGASFGKWVFIKHNNGLSTIYAHLSLIKAVEGQKVKTGDVVGYSGNTGYSTGPHLHFSVYASQGVQILDRQSAVCGGIYHMPIADLKAYLDPMLYL